MERRGREGGREVGKGGIRMMEGREKKLGLGEIRNGSE